MVRLQVLGLACVFWVGACGQTERGSPNVSASAGAGSPNVSASAGAGSPNASASAGAGAGGAAGSAAGSAGAPHSSAGTAGAGGTSLVGAIAECEHYCDSLGYRLPAALCEDWNAPGWEPEFCDIGPTNGCADYCRKVFGTVQPSCAVTLPAVIRCVAPTYAGPAIAPGDCWLRECRPVLFTMTSACYGLAEKLAAARASWEASGITDYELKYWLSETSKAQVVVHAGSEPTVTPPDAIAWTVPALFDLVQTYLDEPGAAPYAQYDAELGYVVSVARQQGCLEPSGGVGQVEVTPLPR